MRLLGSISFLATHLAFMLVAVGLATLAAAPESWSARNMNLSPDGGITPATRRSADVSGINAAYESGRRFDSDIDIPMIDWRHYLEEELDMHHSHQSFATRSRLQKARGNADNQVIWFTDARPFAAFDQTPEAFEVIASRRPIQPQTHWKSGTG
jgi:hypothetical protein